MSEQERVKIQAAQVWKHIGTGKSYIIRKAGIKPAGVLRTLVKENLFCTYQEHGGGQLYVRLEVEMPESFVLQPHHGLPDAPKDHWGRNPPYEHKCSKCGKPTLASPDQYSGCCDRLLIPNE